MKAGRKVKPNIPSTIPDQVILNAGDPIKACPMQCVDNNRVRALVTSHYIPSYLLGDMFIGGRVVLPLPLADCGDPELSRSLSPGLTRIFHLAVFLTS